jgi:hypothetical protein
MVSFCTELAQLHMFLLPTLTVRLAVIYLSVIPFIHVKKVLIKENKLLDVKGIYYNINCMGMENEVNNL